MASNPRFFPLFPFHCWPVLPASWYIPGYTGRYPPPGICLLLPLFVGSPLCLLAVTRSTLVTGAMRACDRFTLLVAGLKRRGSALKNVPFLTPRINLLLARNREIMTKKPATESHCAQGHQECPNPSSIDVKPPLKVLSRLFTPLRSSQTPGPWPPDSR